MTTTIAIVVTAVFCATGAPVVDDKCKDGTERTRIELHIMTSACNSAVPYLENWNVVIKDCAAKATSIFEIWRNDKVITSIPSSAISQYEFELLWLTLLPPANDGKSSP